MSVLKHHHVEVEENVIHVYPFSEGCDTFTRCVVSDKTLNEHFCGRYLKYFWLFSS